MESNDPHDGAIFDARGISHLIYEKLYITMQQTKYRSCGSCGLREEDFHVIPIISLRQIMMPPGQGLYGAQGHSLEYYKLLHTKS